MENKLVCYNLSFNKKNYERKWNRLPCIFLANIFLPLQPPPLPLGGLVDCAPSPRWPLASTAGKAPSMGHIHGRRASWNETGSTSTNTHVEEPFSTTSGFSVLLTATCQFCHKSIINLWTLRKVCLFLKSNVNMNIFRSTSWDNVRCNSVVKELHNCISFA